MLFSRHCSLKCHSAEGRNLKAGLIMQSKQYFVYILASISKILYIGVTNNLQRRLLEHKDQKIGGFTKKYNVKKLVYFEMTDDIYAAISREKELKKVAS